MVELELDESAHDALNAAERGPWTYFLRFRPLPGQEKTQQYAVEAPNDVAKELLEDYLGHSTSTFDKIRTEADLSANHLYGAPHEIHLNIMQTTEDHSALRINASVDNDQE